MQRISDVSRELLGRSLAADDGVTSEPKQVALKSQSRSKARQIRGAKVELKKIKSSGDSTADIGVPSEAEVEMIGPHLKRAIICLMVVETLRGGERPHVF